MKAVPQGPLDGNAPQTARTRRIEAIVVSSDDGLIIDLGPPLGDRYRTRPTDSAEDLIANPGTGETLIILDAVQRPDARALAARLDSQLPAAPIIAIVAAGDEAPWAPALARGTVVAVVPREGVGGPALRHALEAAEARLKGKAAQAATPATAPGAGGRRLPFAPLAAAVLVVLLAAAAAWYYLHGRASPQPVAAGNVAAPGGGAAGSPTASASQPAAADLKPARSALELLSAARIAFASQRQLPRPDTEFKGDSALELYVQALAIDPRNEEARDGVRRLFNVARTRIQSDLANGRFDEVAGLLALFHAAGMEAEATAGIEAELATAKPRWLASQVQAAITAGDIPAAEQALAQLATSGADATVLQDLQKSLDARRQDVQLQDMATAVHAAIASGNLLEPLADNARTRVQAMRQINRTHSATVGAQREYVAALLARVNEASRAQQFEAAQRYLAAAGDVASGSGIADARRQLQADMDLAAQRASAAAAAQAAERASAPAAAPAIINAHPVRPLPVVFPPRALQEQVTGYVIVEFTLKSEGRASDVVVVDSQPKGVFDRAAIDGVAKGRFDTAPLGPEGKPRRARIRLSFK
jgi:TonB family protein